MRVGEQALVIGVTDAQVSVLGETELGAAQAMVAARLDHTGQAGREDAAGAHVRRRAARERTGRDGRLPVPTRNGRR